MQTLVHSCVKVRKPIKLSFGVVGGVGQRTGIRGGSTCPEGKERLWGFFVSIGFNGIFFKQKRE